MALRAALCARSAPRAGHRGSPGRAIHLLIRLLDELAPIGEIQDRTHLGGWALVHEGRMFALVQGERLWLRTDAGTRFDYQRRGMVAFAPNPAMELGAFFEVPPDVLADRDALLAWARKAVAAAPPAAPPAAAPRPTPAPESPPAAPAAPERRSRARARRPSRRRRDGR